MNRPSPPSFEARWLAEAVRLRERARGRLPDGEAMRHARAIGGSAEARIIARARMLGEDSGLAVALQAWRLRIRAAAALFGLLAFLAGVGAALAAAGDGVRAINVVWALGALLGVHVVMLVLWAGGFALSGGGSLGVGALWNWLARRLAGDTFEAASAFAGLHARAGLVRWWLAGVTHGIWSAALAGALAGLLATFLLRGHAFVWETTLLPADFFVGFVAAAGWLPAQLGFAVPDAAAVAASGGSPSADEAARQAWASWLLGCVLIYGLVPRMLLWVGCALRLSRGRATLRLDTTLPGFAELADELAPASERMGVTDAAPTRIEIGRIEGAAHFAAAAAAVAIELRPDTHWPPDWLGAARDLGVADSREQRARALRELGASPVRRLLVVCDARISPDRGSLALIAELSRLAGECAVWLAGADVAEAERVRRWHESLEQIGFAPAAVFDSATAAGAWIVGGTHG
ncbi:DUF2868 domain-containing protein [Pseudazoarcus pumilus]|uniref:DUF2868 domain-containing protein n=1 Tax=Pseudazoarcus pumilus TaxID=2067960 RepID=A0A2I6S8G5_9RHOO|nr:DUF2868 domain-containing protein [Pseudazoarcus pumilus]AUN95511.1 DUF2868 domain-containing protein [Pseudazoarcus pumilus]